MKIIIIFILLLVTIDLFSQNGWDVIYDSENISSPYYRDITFPDNQTGWSLTGSALRKTTDGGLSWKRFVFEQYTGFKQCFYFYNQNLGWVLQGKYLHVTSNGGDSWEVLDSTLEGTRSISLKGILNGWLCGSSGLLKKTTNGGYNWSTIPSGTTNNLNAIAFANEDNGICCGDWGTILSTTNGGANWSLFLDPYLGFFDRVMFLNPQTAFVSGTGNNIYRTTNSGVNWESVYLNNNHISCVRFFESTGFAFGRNAEIFKSTSNGSQWSLFQTGNLLNSINSAAISPNSNILVGSDSGIIYRSTNLGSGWNEIFRNFITRANLTSVYFLNNLTGYACGEQGVLLRSINGGYNWNFVMVNTVFNLTTIRFTDNFTGFICGGNGLAAGIVLKSTNSGYVWQTVYQDSAHLNSIQFLNNQTGWATGSFGYIIKTTNGGNTWSRSRTTSGANGKIWFINEQTGFLTRSQLFRTTNGGLNWALNINSSPYDIQFIGSTGYVNSRNGNNMLFYKTTDAGNNWTYYLPGGTPYGTLFFVDVQTGWISGNGIVRKTTNGGVNWVQQTSTFNTIGVNSIHFYDPNNGWAVGTYGGIMKTNSGGIGITTLSNEIPLKFYLEQNYPNPFNPVTKIRFSIPAFAETTRRVVSLKIYDILGKEIAVLVNQQLKPGMYEVDWSASEVSSGVYFYSLIADDFTQTKKMVVLK